MLMPVMFEAILQSFEWTFDTIEIKNMSAE
jgi:hypothetical protein